MAKDNKLATTGESKKVVKKPKTKGVEAYLGGNPKPIAVLRQPERDSMLSIVGGVTTEQLKAALIVQTEQRSLINDFIKHHLKEGVDYGRIHIVRSCPAETTKTGSCTRDYHFSKSILFKPGQEKIFSLFGITDELEKDEKAYEMLGDVKGLIAYKCIMFRGDKKIGEGRGASTLVGERGDPNSAIKKAEKRARMDACLSLGFSEYFTQDLDDPEYASAREMANTRAAHAAEAKDRDEFGLMPRLPEALIDNAERSVLHKMLLAAGFSDPDEILELLKINGIENPAGMTSSHARAMMGKLKNATFSSPDVKDEPEEPPQSPVNTAPPDLTVDEEFIEHVQEQFNSIGFATRGQQWFMQMVRGMPFRPLYEGFNEDDWRTAYRLINDVLDLNVEIPDHYLRNGRPGQNQHTDPETGEITNESV